MSSESLWMMVVVGVVALAHLYLQAAVTWLVLASNEDSSRKLAQLLSVWLIPFFGPIMIGYFQTEGAHMSNSFRKTVPMIFVPLLFVTGQMREEVSGESARASSESIHDIWTDS